VVVTFINTDGLAFIGPGSEWFSTAVSGIVLAITFIAIYRQLRGQREQARHNTQLLRSQAHCNALMIERRPCEMLIDNEGLASIMSVGLSTPEALNEAEWLRCSSHIFLQIDGWEYLYYQHRDGSIPTEFWVGAGVDGSIPFSVLAQAAAGQGRSAAAKRSDQ
jgi:hypothetical protein